ncbi:homoserine dehydrogenase [Luteimonas sp. e5]
MSREPRLILLGTGTVGSAFVARHAALRAHGLPLPRLAAIANSRQWRACGEHAPSEVLHELRQSDAPRDAAWLAAADFGAGDIVVDASASERLAECHAEWLQAGAQVVTACKLGVGESLARWQRIEQAQAQGGAYGDSATVGAGLPVLRSLRELRAGGDRIHAIAGVLSGSLAWLFNHHDGSREFSALVREARAAGFTEPDPRDDLGGDDVRRKLLILTRAAGHPLPLEAVEVASLLPAALQAVPLAELDPALAMLDEPLLRQLEQARRQGAVLRHVARWQDGVARVGLEALPVEHPLAAGAGTDNRIAIWSDRYPEQPLLIQGPGAGAEVTAAALLDDVLRLAPAARLQAARRPAARSVA